MASGQEGNPDVLVGMAILEAIQASLKVSSAKSACFA